MSIVINADLTLRFLRCRRRTTNSFNANELAKHVSFIQYVLCHISPQDLTEVERWIRPLWRVQVILTCFTSSRNWLFTMDNYYIYFSVRCKRSHSSHGRLPSFTYIPPLLWSVQFDILFKVAISLLSSRLPQAHSEVGVKPTDLKSFPIAPRYRNVR